MERKYSFHSGYMTGAKTFCMPLTVGFIQTPEGDKIYYSTDEDNVFFELLNIDIWNYKHFLDLKIRHKGIF